MDEKEFVKIINSGVRDIAAGPQASYYLMDDGSVWASGVIGFNSNDSESRIPKKVFDSGARAIAAGQGFLLILKADGSLWGLGANNSGELGLNIGYAFEPALIRESGVISISAGSRHSVYVMDDNSLWGMGHNYYNQLGERGDAQRWEQVMILDRGVHRVVATNASTFVLSDKRRPNHFAELNSTVSLEMIWVEPGTFMMGSPETEEGRGNDAGRETQHEVTLTKGFYLGKYEVTQAQYEAVMTGNTVADSNGNVISSTPSHFAGYPNRPVEMVSWNDIQKFLIRLNAQRRAIFRKGGRMYCPTEAQWEYSCRAGSTTVYSWGDTITSSDANFAFDGLGQQTTNVGQYSSNLWGFYDMHGNVEELTADAWCTYATGAQTDPFNEGATGSLRVNRGSWYSPGTNLRSAHRNNRNPSGRNVTVGFRVGFRQITKPPVNLNSVAELTVSENQPIGTVVGEFNATDPDGESRYEIISGVQMSWQEARKMLCRVGDTLSPLLLRKKIILLPIYWKVLIPR